RMISISLSVCNIVDQVNGTRRSTEQSKANQGIDQRLRITQLTVEDDSSENKDVLQPLVWSKRSN
ncbi:MAG TPA: hypothetical protein PKD55_11975, partial [Bellilinea sp.]|nr:hypothetical protein [Bellilinea sp.]